MILSQNHKSSRERGSVLVICMVLAALGTLGVAAWISLIDARGNQVQINFEKVKRRATLQSSKALAYDAFYTNHLHAKNGITSNVTYTVPGNPSAVPSGDKTEYTSEKVAEITIRAYSGTPLRSTSAKRTTKNGATPLFSYSNEVSVTLNDNNSTRNEVFQQRSYNPILGGDLLSIHSPVNFETTEKLISGNIRVNGRAMFWDASANDFKGGLKADEWVIPNDVAGVHDFKNVAGRTTLPLNYPVPMQTTGFFGSKPAYQSELNIVNSGTNPHNAYTHRLSSGGSYQTFSAGSRSVIAPGVATRPDGVDDDTLENDVLTKSTSELMTQLPTSYPLSSRILTAIAEKQNPTPFTEDQLVSIFTSHIPIPHDALIAVSRQLSPVDPKSKRHDLHRANGTAVVSDSDYLTDVYLESDNLQNLYITDSLLVRLHGQPKGGFPSLPAATLEALPPRAIVIERMGPQPFEIERSEDIAFYGENKRRIALVVSTDPGFTAYNYKPTLRFYGETLGSKSYPSTTFPEWQMIMELQNTGAVINAAAVEQVSQVGGIRANRPIDVTAGALSIRQQFNIDGYEDLLSRNAWVESYLTP